MIKQPEQLTMHDLFSKSREDWLRAARKTAKDLLSIRDSITIEDVLERLPRPNYIHRNTTGSVFDSEFKMVGFVKSKRPISKGRWIMKWTLK